MKPLARILTIAFALGTALTVPRAAVAQLAFPMPGARVRVSARAFDGVTREGRLIHATADSLTIAFHGDRSSATIPVTEISRLDVSTGRDLERGVLRGMEIGIVAGVLLGAGLGVYGYASEVCATGCVIGTSLLGSISGLAVGALVGAATAPARWEEVPLRSPASGYGALRPQPSTRVGLTLFF
jgi:hypothetical protein